MTTITTKAQIESITPLTDSIIQLILLPEQYTDYLAGQYLEIQCDNESIAYSIANAPLGSHKYELHIRHVQGNPFDQPLFATIKKEGAVTIHVPMGDCHIDRLDKNKPVIFIAGGTGFAPVKAIIEQLLATGDPRSYELYWGARSQSDLYLDEKVKQWQSHVSHFRYYSLLSCNNAKESLASLLLSRHNDDLSHYQIVISGPFNMVYATRDMLLARGINKKQLFSDAFSFEQQE